MTYFTGDWLKEALGRMWPFPFFGFPLLFAIVAVRASRRSLRYAGLSRSRKNRAISPQQHVEVCVDELRCWMKQLEKIFTYLRANASHQTFDFFKEVLAELRMNIDRDTPIYLQDPEIVTLITTDAPDFERYERSKGALDALANSGRVSLQTQREINEFLDLCATCELDARELKNPAWYSPEDNPMRKDLLQNAVQAVNKFRLQLSHASAKLAPLL